MSKSQPETSDQLLDSKSESSDQLADGDGGLVSRTQQLLNEVDQLLGNASKTDEETPDDDQSDLPEQQASESGGLDDSVATLKQFLNQIENGSDPSSDSLTERGEDEADEDDSVDAAEVKSADATESECPDRESMETEPEVSSNEGDDDSNEDAFLEAVTQEQGDDDDSSEQQPELESEDVTTQSSGFDIEALKRSFEEEDQDEQGDPLESGFEDEDPKIEPSDETEFTDDEPSPGDENLADEDVAVSTERWLAENLDRSLEEEQAAGTEQAVDDHTPTLEQELASEIAAEFETEAVETGDESAESVQSNPVGESTPFESGDAVDLAIFEERFQKIESSFDAMFGSLEQKIEYMFENLTQQVSNLIESASEVAPVMVDRLQASSISHDGSSSIQLPYEAEDESEQDAGSDSAAASSTGDDEVDSTKVSALKEQLTSKLREAEIELSINRAKLSQQKAKIEQMQADLDRREAALDDKLEQARRLGLDKKKGLFDLWKRHIGEEQ